VELSKADRSVEKPVGEMGGAEMWAVYFRYLTDRSKRAKINEVIAREEGIAMASKVLITISKDEVERARLMSEYKYELDNQSKMVQAKRDGVDEGRKQRGIEIAGNFKKLGIPVTQIAHATGLSIEDIAKL
jgi:predicted transposase/invertase (TIGR01784 family)